MQGCWDEVHRAIRAERLPDDPALAPPPPQPEGEALAPLPAADPSWDFAEPPPPYRPPPVTCWTAFVEPESSLHAVRKFLEGRLGPVRVCRTAHTLRALNGQLHVVAASRTLPDGRGCVTMLRRLYGDCLDFDRLFLELLQTIPTARRCVASSSAASQQ